MYTKWFWRVLLGACCTMLPFVTIAKSQSQSFIPQQLKNLWINGHKIFQVGLFRSNQGRSQQININGLIGDYFNVTNSVDENVLAGLGYFLDGPGIKNAKMRYGLNWFYLARTNVKGTVLQENTFTNLSYRYHVTHYPLYVMAQSTFESTLLKKDVSLDIGIGPNFMRVAGFNESALGANTNVDAIFSGKSTTTFSVTAGLNIQFKQLIQPAIFEIGYRIFYLGQGDFQPLTNQTLNTLNTGSVFANALVCSVVF